MTRLCARIQNKVRPGYTAQEAQRQGSNIPQVADRTRLIYPPEGGLALARLETQRMQPPATESLPSLSEQHPNQHPDLGSSGAPSSETLQHHGGSTELKRSSRHVH